MCQIIKICGEDIDWTLMEIKQRNDRLNVDKTYRKCGEKSKLSYINLILLAFVT
jgi:hypothetical protein